MSKYFTIFGRTNNPQCTRQLMTEKDKNLLYSLLQLIDDPDEEVYATVAEQIRSMGTKVISPLESLWETTEDNQVQQRIEALIHDVQFSELTERWKLWVQEEGSILDALILISKYKYPELDEAKVRRDYQKLKQDIWLELNPYLSPIEQINVVNSIFFNFYGFVGVETHRSKEDQFYINRVFESKKGNSYSLGALLSAILEELDVPLRCIQLPHQFLMGYFETIEPLFTLDEGATALKLTMYFDPNNGYVYAQRDIDNYFQKIGEEAKLEYFLPLSKDKLVLILLQELQYYLDQYGDYDAADDYTKLIELVSSMQQRKNLPESED